MLSDCGRYRYSLSRAWYQGDGRVVFVMLNPSTADGQFDDPTVRKCIGFAKRWGFEALDVVNLFAWRSTKPAGLLSAEDPVGYDNDDAIFRALARAQRVVWAWGKHDARVRRLVARRIELWAFDPPCEQGTLGANGDGSPCHPLMLAYSTPLVLGRPQ